MHSHPRFAAALATARITAFKPGQSPPPVTTPIRRLMWLLYSLRGQPGLSIFTDQRDAFIGCIYAMRNFEIDFTGEFVAFLEHRFTSPFHKFGPHFSHENEWCVVKFADLEELPCERQLQQRPNATGHDNKRVGHNHKMM